MKKNETASISRRRFIAGIGVGLISAKAFASSTKSENALFAGRLRRDQVEALGDALVLKHKSQDGYWWRLRSLNLWNATVSALCGNRGNCELSEITPEIFALEGIESLYLKGYHEYLCNEEWSRDYVEVRRYLESGLPAYSVPKLLGNNGYDEGVRPPFQGDHYKLHKQDSMALDQHLYRISMIVPQLHKSDLPKLLSGL